MGGAASSWRNSTPWHVATGTLKDFLNDACREETRQKKLPGAGEVSYDVICLAGVLLWSGFDVSNKGLHHRLTKLCWKLFADCDWGILGGSFL